MGTMWTVDVGVRWGRFVGVVVVVVDVERAVKVFDEYRRGRVERERRYDGALGREVRRWCGMRVQGSGVGGMKLGW